MRWSTTQDKALLNLIYSRKGNYYGDENTYVADVLSAGKRKFIALKTFSAIDGVKETCVTEGQI